MQSVRMAREHDEISRPVQLDESWKRPGSWFCVQGSGAGVAAGAGVGAGAEFEAAGGAPADEEFGCGVPTAAGEPADTMGTAGASLGRAVLMMP